jgi:hypothetical protein
VYIGVHDTATGTSEHMHRCTYDQTLSVDAFYYNVQWNETVIQMPPEDEQDPLSRHVRGLPSSVFKTRWLQRD